MGLRGADARRRADPLRLRPPRRAPRRRRRRPAGASTDARGLDHLRLGRLGRRHRRRGDGQRWPSGRRARRHPAGRPDRPVRRSVGSAPSGSGSPPRTGARSWSTRPARGTSATSARPTPAGPRASTARCSVGWSTRSSSSRGRRRGSCGDPATATSSPSAIPRSANARTLTRRPTASPTPSRGWTRPRKASPPTGASRSRSPTPMLRSAGAVELGASEVTPLFDTEYTRMGAVRDPQGAVAHAERVPPARPRLTAPRAKMRA